MSGFFTIIQVIAALNGSGDMFKEYDTQQVGNSKRYQTIEKCESALAKMMESRYKMVKYKDGRGIVLTQQLHNDGIFANLQCVYIS